MTDETTPPPVRSPARASHHDEANPPEQYSISHGYGRSVFHERHPALLARLLDAFAYTPGQRERLTALVEESRHGEVQPPSAGSPHRAQWIRWHGERYYGGPWSRVPFLWAESYFYWRLLDAVDYFTPGPWLGVDPFAPMKAAELNADGLEEGTGWLREPAVVPRHEAFRVHVLASLYGNRADLGFLLDPAAGGELPVDRAPLLHDGIDRVLRHLDAAPPGEVHLVLDNAGRELLADLLLADHLLTTGLARSVALHVKPRPYYVSDAVGADVRDCLIRLDAFPGPGGGAARRLRAAAAKGVLRLRTHLFHCAPLGYAAAPDDLRAELASAALVVFKGDLNYRRLVGDRAWDPATPFAGAVAEVPGALAAFRTLKSDVLAGVDPATVKRLDADEQRWRTSGRHALVQTRLGPGDPG